MNIAPLNDAARLNREVLPTDDFSAYVIPQYVFTGAVVNSEVRGVGASTEGENKTMRYQWRLIEIGGGRVASALIDNSNGQEIFREEIASMQSWNPPGDSNDLASALGGRTPQQAGIMGMSPAFITLGALGLAWFLFARKKRR